MPYMDKEQSDEVIEALVEFTKRVSGDPGASPAEIAALPEIARLLFDLRALSVT